MEQRCERTLLAHGVVSEVMYCSHCRVFHVNVGALTVHFEAGVLRDLRDTVSAALAATYEHAIAQDLLNARQPVRVREDVH